MWNVLETHTFSTGGETPVAPKPPMHNYGYATSRNYTIYHMQEIALARRPFTLLHRIADSEPIASETILGYAE